MHGNAFVHIGEGVNPGTAVSAVFSLWGPLSRVALLKQVRRRGTAGIRSFRAPANNALASSRRAEHCWGRSTDGIDANSFIAQHGRRGDR